RTSHASRGMCQYMFPSYRWYAGIRSTFPFVAGSRSTAGGSFSTAATDFRNATRRARSSFGRSCGTPGAAAPAAAPFRFRVESGISTRTRIPAMADAELTGRDEVFQAGRSLMSLAGVRGTMPDTADRQKVYSVIDSRFEDFVRELSDYTRVATISAQGTMAQEGADA